MKIKGKKMFSKLMVNLTIILVLVLGGVQLPGRITAVHAANSTVADISSGYRLGFSKTATFTGFPFGKDFVSGGVQLFKKGSTEPVSDFTYEVKSCGENIDAGNGAGTYTIKGVGNFAGELSGSFDIEKRGFGEVVFTMSPTITTYTGVSVQPTVTGTLTTGDKVHTLDPSEYTVTYSNNTNVGEATVTVTSSNNNISNGQQTLKFQISKAPNEVSVLMEGWKIGEDAKYPKVDASADADKAKFDYKAKGAADSAYKSEVPSTSGEYNVRATIQESDNYKAGVATADFTITKEDGTFDAYPKYTQTIDAGEVIVTYGDSNKKISAIVTDPAGGGGTLSYVVKSGSDCIDVASDGTLTIKKAGPATVTVTASETDTCAQTTIDVNVTVAKANSAPAKVSDPENGWTYDGKARRLVVADGAVTDGIMQYSLDPPIWQTSIPTAIDSGDYTVWYKVKGDENHNDSKAQSLKVTIRKADPVVSAPGSLSATCDDLLEDVKLPEVNNGTWSWDAVPGARVEHAGECHFYATFTPTDQINYKKVEHVPVVVNAAKGQSYVKTAPAGKALTYNGEPQALVSAGTAEGGTILYSLDGEDYVDEPSVGIDAGDYYVWYKVIGDANHNDTAAAGVTVTISKANAASATVNANNRIYDGAEKPLVTVTGEASGGEMQYAFGNKTEATQLYTTSIPTATDVGTYYVWYKAKGDENHNDADAKVVEVKISEADIPSIAFDTQSMSLKIGEVESIAATVIPEDAKITWTSDKEAVATVDTTGTVKAVSEGTATITGKITVDGKDYSAECKVTVTEDKPVETPEIIFDVTALSIQSGDEKSVKATVKPEGTAVTWTTDNSNVATVDETGKIKAVSEGTAAIKGTITVDGVVYSAECKVTVTETEPQPTPTPVESSVTLNFSQMLLLQGRERALKATTVPEGIPVTWNSSDSMIAFVTPGGVVTGLKIGMATVTATIAIDGKEYSASCLVNVVPATYRDTSDEHTHKYVWNTIEATEDADGELRYLCETCGDIKERVPLTAYNVFNKNTAEKIRNAKKDATVRIETNKWISFHKMVMEALAERKDVTLEISFLDGEYKGNRCTVVIPKGTDTMSLVDKNGFTGFLFLGGKFGMKTN